VFALVGIAHRADHWTCGCAEKLAMKTMVEIHSGVLWTFWRGAGKLAVGAGRHVLKKMQDLSPEGDDYYSDNESDNRRGEDYEEEEWQEGYEEEYEEDWKEGHAEEEYDEDGEEEAWQADEGDGDDRNDGDFVVDQPVEVFSKSGQQWCPGVVKQVLGTDQVMVQYDKPDGATMEKMISVQYGQTIRASSPSSISGAIVCDIFRDTCANFPRHYRSGCRSTVSNNWW
jgi:hypothetical protein